MTPRCPQTPALARVQRVRSVLMWLLLSSGSAGGAVSPRHDDLRHCLAGLGWSGAEEGPASPHWAATPGQPGHWMPLPALHQFWKKPMTTICQASLGTWVGLSLPLEPNWHHRPGVGVDTLGATEDGQDIGHLGATRQSLHGLAELTSQPAGDHGTLQGRGRMRRTLPGYLHQKRYDGISTPGTC